MDGLEVEIIINIIITTISITHTNNTTIHLFS